MVRLNSNAMLLLHARRTIITMWRERNQFLGQNPVGKNNYREVLGN